MLKRPRALAVGVDGDSLLSTRQALPGWHIEVIDVASGLALDRGAAWQSAGPPHPRP